MLSLVMCIAIGAFFVVRTIAKIAMCYVIDRAWNSLPEATPYKEVITNMGKEQNAHFNEVFHNVRGQLLEMHKNSINVK